LDVPNALAIKARGQNRNNNNFVENEVISKQDNQLSGYSDSGYSESSNSYMSSESNMQINREINNSIGNNEQDRSTAPRDSENPRSSMKTLA